MENRDPVCGTEVKGGNIYSLYKGKRYYFCCPLCKKAFERKPSKYIEAEKGGYGKRDK